MARKKPGLAQIKIRLPVKLRRALEREAAKNDRTLNGEIVYRLSEPIAVMEGTQQVIKKLTDRFIERVIIPRAPIELATTLSRGLAVQQERERAGGSASEDDAEASARPRTRRTIKNKKEGQ